MANSHRAQTEIELKGKTYRLEFNSNAFAELEGALGEDLWSILEKAGKNHNYIASHRFVRAALWAGLQEDPQGSKMSLQSVGKRIEPESYAYILKTVIAAFSLGLPKSETPAEDSEVPLEPVAKDEA